jgi:hypothetical protein
VTIIAAQIHSLQRVKKTGRNGETIQIGDDIEVTVLAAT